MVDENVHEALQHVMISNPSYSELMFRKVEMFLDLMEQELYMKRGMADRVDMLIYPGEGFINGYTAVYELDIDYTARVVDPRLARTPIMQKLMARGDIPKWILVKIAQIVFETMHMDPESTTNDAAFGFCWGLLNGLRAGDADVKNGTLVRGSGLSYEEARQIVEHFKDEIEEDNADVIEEMAHKPLGIGAGKRYDAIMDDVWDAATRQVKDKLVGQIYSYDFETIGNRLIPYTAGLIDGMFDNIKKEVDTRYDPDFSKYGCCESILYDLQSRCERNQGFRRYKEGVLAYLENEYYDMAYGDADDDDDDDDAEVDDDHLLEDGSEDAEDEWDNDWDDDQDYGADDSTGTEPADSANPWEQSSNPWEQQGGFEDSSDDWGQEDNDDWGQDGDDWGQDAPAPLQADMAGIQDQQNVDDEGDEPWDYRGSSSEDNADTGDADGSYQPDTWETEGNEMVVSNGNPAEFEGAETFWASKGRGYLDGSVLAFDRGYVKK